MTKIFRVGIIFKMGKKILGLKKNQPLAGEKIQVTKKRSSKIVGTRRQKKD